MGEEAHFETAILAFAITAFRAELLAVAIWAPERLAILAELQRLQIARLDVFTADVADPIAASVGFLVIVYALVLFPAILIILQWLCANHAVFGIGNSCLRGRGTGGLCCFSTLIEQRGIVSGHRRVCR